MLFLHYKQDINFKKVLIVLICNIFVFFGYFSSAYYFWLKSADNTPENISAIENELGIYLPLVSFIFDPWDQSNVLESIDQIVDQLWTDRIYHFTISPDNYSAKDVAIWAFDEQYLSFFRKVKEKKLHVIFRTMHEMNGWWYPWSSNPEDFKEAWIHVRMLSRLAWLDKENIVFDFSINHWDMPTNWIPSQSAKLIECKVGKKNCWHFEDYYPWDAFVDVIGFTFYNWWKANSNRQWLSPEEILYDTNRKTYERIFAFNKPVIIDEVATTAVRYEWNYNNVKSREEYLNNDERKNYRLSQLQNFLVYRPEILAAIYFNVDYTYWLSSQIVWEADWAIVNLNENKIYNWFWWIVLDGEKKLDNFLKVLFWVEKIDINGKTLYISPKSVKEMRVIWEMLNKKFDNNEEKLQMIQKLKSMNFKSKTINSVLISLEELYSI